MSQVTVTPTVTVANAYGANYVVGGLMTFTNALREKSGILENVVVNMKKVETSGFTLFIFDSSPSSTTWTDAAVAAINAADVAKVKAVIPLAANSQLGTHTALYAAGLGIFLAPNSGTLYGVLIANAALTNNFAAASDVVVTLDVAPVGR